MGRERSRFNRCSFDPEWLATLQVTRCLLRLKDPAWDVAASSSSISSSRCRAPSSQPSPTTCQHSSLSPPVPPAAPRQIEPEGRLPETVQRARTTAETSPCALVCGRWAQKRRSPVRWKVFRSIPAVNHDSPMRPTFWQSGSGSSLILSENRTPKASICIFVSGVSWPPMMACGLDASNPRRETLGVSKRTFYSQRSIMKRSSHAYP